MRRLLIGVAVGIAVAAVAVGAFVLGNRSRSVGGPDPEAAGTIELPEPDPAQAGPVGDYLAGPGALVLRFRALSAPLTTLSTLSAAEWGPVCSTVANQLNAEVDAADLLDAAAAIPDPVLAEVAVSERTARGQALTSCLGNADFGSPLEELLLSVEAADVLFTRRLDQL